jgi:hypothetical protein
VREGEGRRQESSQEVWLAAGGLGRRVGCKETKRPPHPSEIPIGDSSKVQHQNVRNGLIKRTKKGRDLNGVKLRFISETEGPLAISEGKSARVHCF